MTSDGCRCRAAPAIQFVEEEFEGRSSMVPSTKLVLAHSSREGSELGLMVLASWVWGGVLAREATS